MIARMGELWDRLRGRPARSDHSPAGPVSFRGVLREDALELTHVLPFVLSSVPDAIREAATAIGRFPDEAAADLRRALLDRHPTIRGIARFYLRQRGTTDLRDFYREVMERATGPGLRASLAGLGEIGTAEDAPLVERFLGDPLPGVRRVAVGALARLTAETSVSHFLEALQDRSAGVSRAGRLALAPHAGRVGAERLGATLEEHPETHVRINALSLLSGLGKWEGIPWLVRACGSADERVARVARQYVRRWMERFNRSYTRPTLPQLDRMAAALDQAGSALSKDQERRMRFYMTGF